MIETGRLLLRDWREGERALHPPHSTPSGDALAGRRPAAAEMATRSATASSRSQGEHGFTFWAVERKEDGALLGFCGLKLANESAARSTARSRSAGGSRGCLGPGLCQGGGGRLARFRLRSARGAAGRRAHRRRERAELGPDAAARHDAPADLDYADPRIPADRTR